jgi:carbon-monoxide dehydrogenase medium subunit
MERFGYVRAESVRHAIALLNEPGVRSRPLAGGTDLLLQARSQPRLVDRVVDIGLLPELHQITLDGDGRRERVTIGAAASFSEVLASPVVRATAPLLADACRQVGAVQIRNQGTLGGNVANAAACADSLPALVCLDATARVVTPAGAQDYPVCDLVIGPNRTRIPAGGVLVSLSYTVPAARSRGVFLKLGRRNAMAISRLTVAALGRLDDEGCIDELRLVAGSATPQIRRLADVETALLCRLPGADLWTSAGRLAAEEMVRIAGRRWSTDYKEIALASLVAEALAAVFGPSNEGPLETGQPAVRGWYDGHHAQGPVERGLPSEPQRAISATSQPAAAPTCYALTVNGSPVAVSAAGDRRLLDVLRDDLGLTGTKEGCGVGECGACSVLLDGRLVNSCLVLVAQAAGRDVVTIEGIRGPAGSPNDLQQSFIDHGAVQCGYCIPGMVLAGEALLAANPAPSRTDIREAIAGNLCRCTGYQQIVDAIEATAGQRSHRAEPTDTERLRPRVAGAG